MLSKIEVQGFRNFLAENEDLPEVWRTFFLEFLAKNKRAEEKRLSRYREIKEEELNLLREQGLTNRQIGKRLGVSLKTVELYVRIFNIPRRGKSSK